MHRKMRGLVACAVSVVGLVAAAETARGSFHITQIEQVIGGVNGDTTAQAIQLRARSGGQNVMSEARIWVSDATGANRISILDMTTNVSNAAGGARVLIASSNFSTYTPGLNRDFTMTNLIPVSYFNGGKLTFEQDGGTVSTPGTVLWSLAFGSYTGSNTGDFTNDADGNFGSPTVALPSSSTRALQFTGSFSDPSTTNAANYALTGSAATFTNNAGNSAVVVPEPGGAALLVAAAAFRSRRRARR